MGRPLRIEFENAWYHVMNRGANHQNIYINRNHREMFLYLLEEIAAQFFVEIHAYCLMDNHYHLLLRTPFPNLGKAMRHLDGIYTRRFNISQKKDGPLFRGRYKAILIEEDDYLLQVSRYIHLNPVEAKICKLPNHYEWSSYQYYIDSKNKFYWLKTDAILNYFHGQAMINQAMINYVQFVNEGIDEETEIFYHLNPLASIFGTKKFVDEKLSNTTIAQRLFCNPDIKRVTRLLSVEEIMFGVAEYFSVEVHTLRLTKPGIQNLPRMAAIYLSKYLGQVNYKKISENFTNITPASVSMVIKRCEQLIQNDEKFKIDLLNIKNTLQ